MAEIIEQDLTSNVWILRTDPTAYLARNARGIADASGLGKWHMRELQAFQFQALQRLQVTAHASFENVQVPFGAQAGAVGEACKDLPKFQFVVCVAFQKIQVLSPALCRVPANRAHLFVVVPKC